MNRQEIEPYSGIDNLEVMQEAKNYNRFLIELIESMAKQGDKILDFGAGGGTFALPISQKGYNVACVEPDSSLLEHLKRSGLEAHQDIAQVSTVDYIYTLNVLEHIEDDQLAATQLFDKLKTGGKLLVYVPAFNVLYSSMDKKVGHWRRYRRRQLMDILEKTGFEIQAARYVDSLGFFASLLYKMIDNKSGDINLSALKLYDAYVFPLSRLFDRIFSRILGKNLLVIAAKK